LGDIYGHRRLILLGLAVFLAASVGCLAAPSIGWLIGSRAVQGIGAALLWPCIVALGSTSVAEDKRGLVMGLLMGGITTGNVGGPLLAGVVTWLGDWRLFFLINTAMSALSMLLAWRFLQRETPGKVAERVDAGGIAVLGLALLTLLYALDVGADWGWTAPALIGLLAASAVLFAVFPVVEARAKDPLLPPSLMRNREFLLTLSMNGLLIPALFIAFLYFPQYLQRTMGWSVLAAAFGVLPLMVLLAVGSVLGGRLYAPFGPKRLLLTGYSLVTLGAATIAVFKPSWGFAGLLPAMLLMGLGATLCVSTAGTAAVSAVPPARAGVAGGLSFMVHLCLGALGVAGATAIMNAATVGSTAAQADQAFAVGLRHAYWLATALAVIGIAAAAAIDEKKLQGGKG